MSLNPKVALKSRKVLFLTNTTEGGGGEVRCLYFVAFVQGKPEAKAEIQDGKRVVTDEKPNTVKSVKLLELCSSIVIQIA